MSRHNHQYGGQAVIEGVMMRGPRFFAVAVRRANKEIVTQSESVEAILRRFQWLNKPFLRGTLALIDAMALGMKTLMFSAKIAQEDIEREEAAKRGQSETAGEPGTGEPTRSRSKAINDIAVNATLALGLVLAVGIFFVSPQLMVGALSKWVKNSVLLNLIVGGVKFGLFIGYIAAISRLEDIRRVFQYHGAEHKVINAFEAGQSLEPQNFAKQTTIHPRCGTNFILVVIMISVVVFVFLGWSDKWYIRVAQRLPLLPVVAGIAYEVIRFAGKQRDSRFMRVIVAPGLWLQKLTTREPTEDQVEVASRALEVLLEREEEEDALALLDHKSR